MELGEREDRSEDWGVWPMDAIYLDVSVPREEGVKERDTYRKIGRQLLAAP